MPWYRRHAIEPGWTGRLLRRETTSWGTIRRVHPFPGGDKRDLPRRAAGFAGFSLLAGWAGVAAGGRFRRADAVIAMSPPLTLGLTGRVVAWTHRAPLVFNIQDVFPDAAVETGAITDRRVIRIATWLERLTYRSAQAVTVLSDDLRDNVVAKIPARRAATVHVIPNFVDTSRITPGDRLTPYRRELGIGEEPVLLYAGNVGYSQSVELLLAVARARPDVTVLVNGEGVARAALEEQAAGLPNVRFAGYVPEDRLPELLATGDVHAVPLRRGLAAVSVPSRRRRRTTSRRSRRASTSRGSRWSRRAHRGTRPTWAAPMPERQERFTCSGGPVTSVTPRRSWTAFSGRTSSSAFRRTTRSIASWTGRSSRPTRTSATRRTARSTTPR